MENRANVVSKFRTGYWIRQFINFAGGLFLIGFCFYLSLDNGEIDFQNVFFWAAAIGIVSFIFYAWLFMFHELKQLTVTDKGIELRHLLIKRTDLIPYNEIINYRTTRITQRQGVGRTSGYRELEIQLTNERVLTFNEDQYDNYTEIKNSIYVKLQNYL